jgi:molybdopterin/thiamine biosynthesis adenylyltransferase
MEGTKAMNEFIPKIKKTIEVHKMNGHVYFRTCGYATEVEDKTGLISALCDHLDGSNNVDNLSKILNSIHPEATHENISRILSRLDEAYFLEHGPTTPGTCLDNYDLQRWDRNIDFFGSYCRLGENKYDHQAKLKSIRVALLGLGGLGSHLLYDLVALGVHDIRAVDFDKVDLPNLNRQILYSELDIGRLKTQAAKEQIYKFNSRLKVEFIQKKIASTSDIEEIIEGRDIVICVADKPKMRMAGWLNEACIKLNVPFITGGLDLQRAAYYTVLPKITGCVECWSNSVRATDKLSNALLEEDERSNIDVTAPVLVTFVSTLTGLMLSDFVKLVTGISNPLSAGRLREFDFNTTSVTDAETWSRNRYCCICGD